MTKQEFDRILDAIPLARWGFYELQAVAVIAFVAAAAIGWQGLPWAWAATVPLAIAWAIVWFYRDPPRTIPDNPTAFLSPADGRVAAIDCFDHYDFFDGPATRIGIFLSVFDVHINRAPRAGSVIETDYQPGERRNTLDPKSVDRNEFMWIGLEDGTGQRYAVRQIAGLIARRIVCELKPGDAVLAGYKFGMIKFGSRTELIVPADVEVTCKVGDRVRAGESIVARVAAGESS